ncbi:7174_t:CDS:1, partial [Racocetra persica]
MRHPTIIKSLLKLAIRCLNSIGMLIQGPKCYNKNNIRSDKNKLFE